MRVTLPYSNVVAIPFGHLPRAEAPYDAPVEPQDLKRIRKLRLRALIAEVGGQNVLAQALDVEPNYISQLLKPGKSFGERIARKIEQRAGKPERWLDTETVVSIRPTEWPFSFDRALWDRLPLNQKREIEATFQKLVLGASVQEFASPTPPSKRHPA